MNLNDSDILRAERGIGTMAEKGHAGRKADEMWLTRDQALRVAVWSDTSKGDRGVTSVVTPSGTQQMVVLNEAGRVAA